MEKTTIGCLQNTLPVWYNIEDVGAEPIQARLGKDTDSP